MDVFVPFIVDVSILYLVDISVLDLVEFCVPYKVDVYILSMMQDWLGLAIFPVQEAAQGATSCLTLGATREPPSGRVSQDFCQLLKTWPPENTYIVTECISTKNR